MRMRLIFTIIGFATVNNIMAQSDSLEQGSNNKIVISASYAWVIPSGEFSVYSSMGQVGTPSTAWGGRIEVDYLFSKFLGVSCAYITSANETVAPTRQQLFPQYPGRALGGRSSVTDYTYSCKS
jgi:hypothetical protein